MKKILLALFLFGLFSTLSFAAIPETISVQGRATNTQGAPLPSTTVLVNLYTVQSGGTPISGISGNSVTTDDNGIYNAALSNLSNVNFGNPVYVGIKIGTDSELSPRQPLTTAPYAMRTKDAENVVAGGTVTTGAITGGALTATSGTINGPLTVTGSLTAGSIGTNVIVATSTTAYAVEGYSNSVGVNGVSSQTGVAGTSTGSGCGVFGYADGAGGWGVYGDARGDASRAVFGVSSGAGYSGYFSGGMGVKIPTTTSDVPDSAPEAGTMIYNTSNHILYIRDANNNWYGVQTTIQ